MHRQGVIRKIQSIRASLVPDRRSAQLLSITIVFIVLGLLQIIPAARQAAVDGNGDLSRQWVVLQYVIRGVNPYPIAFAALERAYGVLAPRGPVHLQDVSIYGIPRHGPHPLTDRALGPPEATYPPQSLILLLPLGLLPRAYLVLFWLALNLWLVFIVAHELRSFAVSADLGFLFFVGLVAVWPPTSYCIERDQFSLLVLCCILVGSRIQSKRPIIASLLYSFSLVKLSLTIPFLMLPLTDKAIKTTNKLKMLLTIAGTQLILLGTMSVMVDETPRELIAGWLSVAAYFRAGGAYTVQHMINDLRLDGSFLDYAVQIGVLLTGMLLAIRLERRVRLGFLALVACIWTYHVMYDFVVLLIPLTLLADAPLTRSRRVNWIILIFLVAGMTRRIYFGPPFTEIGALQLMTVLLVLLTGLARNRVEPKSPQGPILSRLSD